jgi:hypothetical protein
MQEANLARFRAAAAAAGARVAVIEVGAGGGGGTVRDVSVPDSSPSARLSATRARPHSQTHSLIRTHNSPP